MVVSEIFVRHQLEVHMPFVTLKTNHLSPEQTGAVEAACKRAWVKTGNGFSEQFAPDDVGGVVVAASFGELILHHTLLEFYYVDRGTMFSKTLREQLERELMTVLSSSSTILLCPTKAERWFTDPTWVVREKSTDKEDGLESAVLPRSREMVMQMFVKWEHCNDRKRSSGARTKVVVSEVELRKQFELFLQTIFSDTRDRETEHAIGFREVSREKLLG